MEINFFSNFDSDRYSGGRIHAWKIIQGLSDLGVKINLYTNNLPIFYSANSAQNIRVFTEINKAKINYHVDLAIIVPNINYNFTSIQMGLQQIYHGSCPIVTIDFESLRWFNSKSDIKRARSRYLLTDIISKYSSTIISSTRYGSEWAKQSYLSKFNSSGFRFLYPYIDIKPYSEKEAYDLMVMVKNDKMSPSKSFDRYIKIFKNIKYKMHICILGNLSEIEKEELNTLSRSSLLKFDTFCNVDDEIKYKLMSSSRNFLFLSNFEGFGMPPVEASLNGCHVVSSKLSTLEEVMGNKIDMPENDEKIAKKLEEFIKEKRFLPTLEDSSLRDRVSFNTFKVHLKEIINEERDIPKKNKAERLLIFILIQLTKAINKIKNK